MWKVNDRALDDCGGVHPTTADAQIISGTVSNCRESHSRNPMKGAYRDDLVALNNNIIEEDISKMNPDCMQVEETTSLPSEIAHYLDLNLAIPMC